MKPTRGPSKITLTTLTISYLFFVSFLYIIFIKVLSEIDYTTKIAPALILFAILIPTTFIIAIGFKFYQVNHEKKSGNIGSKFKSRIVIYFILIIMLGMLPQTGLSILFLKTVGTTWLPDNTIPTLKKGLKTAFFYYEEKIDNLKNICDNPLFINSIQNYKENNNIIFENAKLMNPDIVTIQINTPNKRLVLGNKNLVYKDNPPRQDGSLPRLDTEDKTFLRYNKIFMAYGERNNAIVTIEVPIDIIKSASEFSTLVNYYEKINIYKTNLTRYMTVIFVIIFFPLFFIVVLLSLYIIESITQPITAIEEASKNIIDGDMSVRIIDKESNDFGLVTTSFNKMISKLEYQNQTHYEKEKIKIWADFSEIIKTNILEVTENTLLDFENFIKEANNNIDPKFSAELDKFKSKLENFTKNINDFKNFTNLDEPQLLKLNISDTIKTSIKNLNLKNKDITIAFNNQKDFFILADKKLITELLTQLLDNSVDAISYTGKIEVNISTIRKNTETYCRISITDNGKGIDENIKTKIFQPYFTTKLPNVGIGLTIVERIVFLHRGQIKLETEKNGTTFYVDIPECC